MLKRLNVVEGLTSEEVRLLIALGPGSFVALDPHQRHDVSAQDDYRILLLLTPWPAPDRRMSGAG